MSMIHAISANSWMVYTWVATVLGCGILFLVGIYLQKKEKRDQLTKIAERVLRENLWREAHGTQDVSASMLGTVYGSTTQYERRRTSRV